jgi:hypothetical protein
MQLKKTKDKEAEITIDPSVLAQMESFSTIAIKKLMDKYNCTFESAEALFSSALAKNNFDLEDYIRNSK